MAAAWRRERPESFIEALKAARDMLSANPVLVAKGSIETEAEQLVIAAYRESEGKLLTRMELYARVQDRYPDAAGKRLLELAGTRAEGKPLQHVTVGRNCSAAVRPTETPLPVSCTTSHISATVCIQLPVMETTWPLK